MEPSPSPIPERASYWWRIVQQPTHGHRMPCSALDPIATANIEHLVRDLRGQFTIVMLTHNLQQATRVNDYTGFMRMGHHIEIGPTSELFSKPRRLETGDYVPGRFG